MQETWLFVHTCQIPCRGKNLMVFPPISWSYGGGGRSHSFWKKKKTFFFLISSTFGSFLDVAAGNKPILWEGTIWAAWHVSKLTPSQVSFVNWDLLKVKFLHLRKHQLKSAPCHWLPINASWIALFIDSCFFLWWTLFSSVKEFFGLRRI